MLTPEQDDFYHRWLQKANHVNGHDVADLIDEYVSLFIVYNFLYNIVPAERYRREGVRREYVKDMERATAHMVGFVGAKAMANHLDAQGLNVGIKELADAMPHFNIVLDKGRPRKLQDERLILELTSDDALKMLAVMKILYHIRCNIVHGEKGLYQYQELLLLPALTLLRAIVVYLHDRLLEVR
ncbi:hypothetical protein [Sphingobacterium bambusae]|uniref:Apea-like HEPN domain-containing protein n=1 Tax=Sphingobacterium bambusae TaxID=662858 RepID=A0ABW6BC41_9SPHI|nr:hypothetical protein [Sphingobacterium bambusae]WPL48547.1 hypothetical protein SCB77_21600 [Sphingobacterium bambusae]